MKKLTFKIRIYCTIYLIYLSHKVLQLAKKIDDKEFVDMYVFQLNKKYENCTQPKPEPKQAQNY